MHLTRRDLLAAGAFGALAACTTEADLRPAPVDPDVALLAAAIAREQVLLLAYEEAIAAHPQLSATLEAVRAEHQQHLTRLSPGGQPSATPTEPLMPTAPPTPSTRADRPQTRRAALAALERSSARAHGAAALTASRRLAPVLASLCASEASHAVVL